MTAHKFDPASWEKLENEERLTELPPALIARLLKLTGSETLVDFGAGTGMFSIPLARELPRGKVYAVDELEELLAILAEKLGRPENADVAGRLTPIHTSGGAVPLPDGAADCLLALNVLHHIDDDPRAQAEMIRLVRPGGRFAIIEFGKIDRPVGPPKDHVLAHDEVRRLVAGMGLRETEYHEPGELVPYHVVIAAEKPAG